MTTYKPLPVSIPTDYCETLDISPGFLSRCNRGERRLPMDKAVKLMELAPDDERLTGLTLIHLRNELEIAVPHLCNLKPKRAKKA